MATLLPIALLLQLVNPTPVHTPMVRQTIELASDGFPTGSTTPEGAACDFARAFISRNPRRFLEVSLPPHGGGNFRKAYESFLSETTTAILAEAERKGSQRGPSKIGKVFAARRLSRDGPASWAYASYGFQGVLFVDVGVHLHEGDHSLNRTLVVKNAAGAWRVHPAPQLDELISMGLNQESQSVTDFAGAYEPPK